MDQFGLVVGAIYSRQKDIHPRFGGSQQSGISTAPESKIVMIFSGDSGKKFGYVDTWDVDRQTFTYTGHGQAGDMEFKRGNRALRDHVVNGWALLVFEKSKESGMYRYVGEMQCAGTDYALGKDANDAPRKLIQFQLVRIGSEGGAAQNFSNGEDDSPTETVKDLRVAAYAAVKPQQETPKQARRNLHRRSQAVVTYALFRAKGKCECCGENAPFNRADGTPYLEVHHIERLSDGGLDAPEHVAALCPTCHRRVHCAINRVAVNEALRSTIQHLEKSLGKVEFG